MAKKSSDKELRLSEIKADCRKFANDLMSKHKDIVIFFDVHDEQDLWKELNIATPKDPK